MSIAPPSHTRRKGVTTDSWITPRKLLARFGPFDFDPCVATPQPWPTAAVMIDEATDGMMIPWVGYVWMNPPYGPALEIWLNRMAVHNNGLALVFARTETRAFFRHVWPHASGLLFLRSRLTFFTPEGKSAPQGHNSGGPSVLIAYGARAKMELFAAKDLGAFVTIQQ